MFRPEPMQYFELLLARDHAQELLEAIGRLECLEFVDLNAKVIKSNLHSAPQARRCEDLLTKIEQMRHWADDHGIEFVKCKDVVREIKRYDSTFQGDIDKSKARAFDEAAKEIDDRFQLIKRLDLTTEDLGQSFIDILHRVSVNQRALSVLGQVGSVSISRNGVQNLCGIIPTTHRETFRRLLFRVMRGQVVCEMFDYEDYNTDIRELFDTLKFKGNSSSNIEVLALVVQRELATAGLYSKFRVEQSYFRAVTWVPISDEIQLESMIKLELDDPSLVQFKVHRLPTPKNTQPPTSVLANDILAPYQALVNTYGIPRYREINPAAFIAATFPATFGIMFGDVGHGLVLLIAGIGLFFSRPLLEANGLEGLYKIRWLIFSMGLFSVYSGFIYNEFMALRFPIFQSCFTKLPTGKVSRTPGCTYPFGFDHIWLKADNEIGYFNSFRTKLAIGFGVGQMTLGVLLKGANCILNLAWTDLLFDFLPQLVFLVSLFGYLIFLIVYKWTHDWTRRPGPPPNILSILVNLHAKPKGDTAILPDADFQSQIQWLIITVCMVCVPVMLCGKPLVMLCKKKLTKNDNHSMSYAEELGNDIDVEPLEGYVHHSVLDSDHDHKLVEGDSIAQLGHEESHDDFGEVCVHQLIETIEFVLGSISNTASYLRLWALSLAHSQLSEVMYELILGHHLAQPKNVIIDSLAGSLRYFFLTVAIIGIILMTDSLECFLHTLRLHWVEFQNKFYKGDGRLFKPFKTVLSSEESEGML